MRILNSSDILSDGNIEGKQIMLELLEAGLASADPYINTRNLFQIKGMKLLIGNPDFEADGDPRTGIDEINLDEVKRIYVFGAGKGIQRMAKAVEDVLGDRITGGHIIVKYGDFCEVTRIGVTHGAHPVPDENCVNGCRRIVSMIQEIHLTPCDLVITLVGNGISSLMTLPVEGVSLDSVKQVTKILQIEKGINTNELNCVRNILDQLKGGRITRLLKPARMVHLICSDVNTTTDGEYGWKGLMETNNWLHTLPDIANRENAIEILNKYNAWNLMGDDVKTYIENMAPKQEGMKRDEFESLDARVFGVLPNKLGLEPSVRLACQKRGLSCYMVNREMFLEAAQAGKFFAGITKEIARENQPVSGPCVLIMLGEKVVTVGKEIGVGGRNQEFSVAAALSIEGEENIVIASIDTDGTDGPGGYFDKEATERGVTALAGGIVDGYTAVRCRQMGMDISEALKKHGSSKPLWKTGAGVWTTQNVSITDLTLALIV